MTAVKAGQHRLTFTGSGLVHWLVVDVAGGVAASNGQDEEAAWLRGLSVPAAQRSPAVTGEVLGRVLGVGETTLLSVLNEAVGIDGPLAGLARRPEWIDQSLACALDSGLWVGATRTATRIAFDAFETAAARDKLEQLKGHPLDEGGWVASWLWSVEADLRQHARELTRWPIIAGEVEMVLGGQEAFWPVEALEAG